MYIKLYRDCFRGMFENTPAIGAIIKEEGKENVVFYTTYQDESIEGIREATAKALRQAKKYAGNVDVLICANLTNILE